MGIVNIQNITEVKFRTDCMRSDSYKKFHVRDNAIIQPVVFNKGLPDEYTVNYTIYDDGYAKLRDIQVRMPDLSIKTLEIGYNPIQDYRQIQYGIYNPIVADRLLFNGESVLGDVNYLELIFDRPAIGVKSLSQYAEDRFALISRIYPQGSAGYVDGVLYEQSAYTQITGYKVNDIYSNVYKEAQSTSGWDDKWELVSCNSLRIGAQWQFNYINAAGDKVGRNGGYYQNGAQSRMLTANEIINLCHTSTTNKPELHQNILQNFPYGGIEYVGSYIDWNTGILGGNHTHGHLSPDGAWNSPDFLSYLFVPFINEEEYNASKSPHYFWTVAQRNKFNEIYDA